MPESAAQPTVVHFVANVGGGVWTCVKTMAAHQRQRWRVCVVGVYKGQLRPQFDDERATLFDDAYLARRPRFPGSYHLMPLDVERALDEIGVDRQNERNVYQFHTGPYTALVYRLPKKPQRGLWLASFHGARGNFGDTRNPFKRALHGRCVRRMLRDGLTLSAVSRRSAEDCAEMYGCRPDDFHIVYNGAGAGDQVEPVDGRANVQSPLRVGFVGTVSKIKGWRKIVQAVDLLRAQGRDVECVIVGDGAESPELQQMAHERNWLSAPGHVADPRNQIMPTFDVLVLPSDFEGHPIVVLEAMSLGVPCVCSDVGGNAETIRDGLEGFILRSNSPEEIAARIEEIAATPGLWRRLAVNCLDRHRSMFTAQRMVENWEQLYLDRLPSPDFQTATVNASTSSLASASD